MSFKFIDEAVIRVLAGKGGNGCVSFRHEKFIEFGGPNGGNGGKGGDVILEASHNLNTLSFFKYRGIHKARSGRNGMSQGKAGAKGIDLVLGVPIGTCVHLLDEDGENKVGELLQHGQRAVIAKGGDGGIGNTCFKSSTNQRPMYASPGKPGQEYKVKLSLRVISDIGIVGKPNCGKSTLLNALTNARSKVGDYAFTTVRPHLGAMTDAFSNYTIADIPGLIEGASRGLGCGHIFLRHIEKCTLIVHVIDISSDVVAEYNSIREELKQYDISHNTSISKKPELILLNKSDLLGRDDIRSQCETLASHAYSEILVASLLNPDGVHEQLRVIWDKLDMIRPRDQWEYRPDSGY